MALLGAAGYAASLGAKDPSQVSEANLALTEVAEAMPPNHFFRIVKDIFPSFSKTAVLTSLMLALPF